MLFSSSVRAIGQSVLAIFHCLFNTGGAMRNVLDVRLWFLIASKAAPKRSPSMSVFAVDCCCVRFVIVVASSVALLRFGLAEEKNKLKNNHPTHGNKSRHYIYGFAETGPFWGEGIRSPRLCVCRTLAALSSRAEASLSPRR